MRELCLNSLEAEAFTMKKDRSCLDIFRNKMSCILKNVIVQYDKKLCF